MDKEKVLQIIAVLSEQILNLKRAQVMEENNPIRSADYMDAYIKNARETADSLRQMREQYENLYACWMAQE